MHFLSAHTYIRVSPEGGAGGRGRISHRLVNLASINRHLDRCLLPGTGRGQEEAVEALNQICFSTTSRGLGDNLNSDFLPVKSNTNHVEGSSLKRQHSPVTRLGRAATASAAARVLQLIRRHRSMNS
ncbi:hypothetical protein EVAR_43204_1 [Eumeta japonica]|uniref:Uncharacterized protein n=1 Tax=Eumeta variegata TaxID=151549 RepID=A0A4C1WVB3_EUMVA|nr:hypothetical protein EVAR_43204_1 [Eumeta japonica]